MHFSDFFGPWKKWPEMAPNGALEVFFRLIQTLPTFWAERIWILRILIFEMFWIPNFWISRSPASNSQSSRFSDFQVPRFPDAAGAAAGRTLRSQSDSQPDPNAPRDQIRRKGPYCDNDFEIVSQAGVIAMLIHRR